MSISSIRALSDSDALGLIPAISAGWIDASSLIIDAKSGVSGAGRGTSLMTHYAEINENFKAYKVNKHQHIPEVEQVLTQVAGEPITVYHPFGADDAGNHDHHVCHAEWSIHGRGFH